MMLNETHVNPNYLNIRMNRKNEERVVNAATKNWIKGVKLAALLFLCVSHLCRLIL